MVKILGKAASPGRFRYDDGRARIEYKIEDLKPGLKVTGTAKGRLGRIEVFRSPAPREFLLNNWQSWGPLQKMRQGERHQGLEEVMSGYSPYVFTPVPETFRSTLVSDYFVAWRGHLAGFLSSKFAHPFFAFEGSDLAGYLEYFGTELDDAVPLEPLVILEEKSKKKRPGRTPRLSGEGRVESLLENYGLLAATGNKVTVSAWNPVGWSSWYQYFTNLRWEDVEKNLKIGREIFPFEVFQIDDGYEKDIGDWLETKAGFRSLPELARLIKSYGYVAGIWTAPFSAAETSSLYLMHPEWMVAEEGRPKECYKGWGKRIYALDTTHPEVKSWLAETFSALKKMGFDYFKIDFLFAAAMPGRRAKSVTPVQAYREGLETVRHAVGKSFVLGCGAPLLPSLGWVEGMRIGEDTAPCWDTGRGAFQGANAYYALKNSLMRSFMHRRWWLNDPDCLLLRSQDIELTPEERELYALVAGALDNMIIESDDLSLVDEAGRQLLQKAISLKGGKVKVTGLMGDDPYLIQSRKREAGELKLLANLSNSWKAYASLRIPARSARFVEKE
jgi:alpha-galactosidase